MLKLVGTLIFLYLALLVVVFLIQKKMTYFPSRYPQDYLVDMAPRLGLEPWRDTGGAIVGWRNPGSGAARNRVVVFHGNGGMALDRADFVRALRNLRAGSLWDVYLFEYPGYGGREGEPREKEFVSAAVAAIRNLESADRRPIYLIGESIGAGVASQVASHEGDSIAGLFLITPFTTLADVAAHHYAVIPVRLVMREKFDNMSALSRYHGPVAFLFAGRDEIVPARFSQALYESYAGPKKLWTQDTALHNTLDYGPSSSLWREVSEWLTEDRER